MTHPVHKHRVLLMLLNLWNESLQMDGRLTKSYHATVKCVTNGASPLPLLSSHSTSLAFHNLPRCLILHGFARFRSLAHSSTMLGCCFEASYSSRSSLSTWYLWIRVSVHVAKYRSSPKRRFQKYENGKIDEFRRENCCCIILGDVALRRYRSISPSQSGTLQRERKWGLHCPFNGASDWPLLIS